ncbi:MAG: SpoIIE family protein phosphatase [Verrucomicrobiaceae bacterium]|nr:SpoIIE family protein phosphatase [Verrucomicrobiaceae bacterium]
MTINCQPSEGLHLDFQSSPGSAREAVLAATHWLRTQGLSPEECQTWELVLAEATSNAVTHSNSKSPLRFHAFGTATSIEIQLIDRSSGFDWPDEPVLPEDDESEAGRGLFIIQQLTDQLCYLRGRGENLLRMSRARRTAKAKAEDLSATLDLMTGEVTSCYETLANIFRLSAEAAHDVPPVALAAKWLEELRQISGADFLSLRMLTPDGSQLAAFATAPADSFTTAFIDLGNTNIIESRAAIQKQDQWFDGFSVFDQADPLSYRGSAVSGIAHPLETGGQVIGVLTLGVCRAQWEPKAREINVVRSLGDFLGTLLHSLRSRDEATHSRLIKRELQIAADIQRSLLPAELPQSATLQCAGHLTTVGEVGGDFLDGIALADGGRLFVIADVMGKGVPAALFATAFRSLLHSHLDLATQPGELMSRLSASLFLELDRADMFITVQLAYVSADGLTLRACSAGHGPLLLAGGDQITEISADGPPIGVEEDATYPQQEADLNGITHLLMHTDGLSDATLPKGCGLGRDMLHHWLRATSVEGIDAWSSRDSLLHMHSIYQDKARAHDDATFVVLVRASALLQQPKNRTLTHAHR